MQTCYYFKDGSAVLVIHEMNNLYAAKKGMLKMYGKSESDIVRYDSGSNVQRIPHQVFDGRKYH